MQQWESVLASCILFKDINNADYAQILERTNARIVSYEPNDLLIRLGETTTFAGIVLDGTVEIGFYDEAGSPVNVNHLQAPEPFADAIACSRMPSVIQARAVNACTVLWMDTSALMASAASGTCPSAAQLMENMVRMLSRKNIFLNRKMQILAQKRTRDRIKMYLRNLCLPDSDTQVSFSRNDLAHYLNVDRSALSRELGRMRDEGIIEVKGNAIVVIDPSFLG